MPTISHHPPSIARRSVVAVLAMILIAVTAAACSSGDTASGEGAPAGRPTSDESVRINELQFIGTHNSYKTMPSEKLLDFLRGAVSSSRDSEINTLDPNQIAYGHRPLTAQLDSGIRSFELDIWADPTGGRFAHPLAAQLLGQPLPTGVDAPGFDVMHIQEADYLSTCPTLEACLKEMKTWSDAHPRHLPITVNLELKQDPLPKPFDVTPIQPYDAVQLDALDAAIRSVVGDRLITPDSVRGKAPELRTAVTKKESGGGWPTIADSRGHFLLFMDNEGDLPKLYLQGHPSLRGRALFTSDGFDRSDGAVLKVNDPGEKQKITSLVRDGYLVRTRADADLVTDGPDKTEALGSGAQLVHTDFPSGEAQAGTGYVVSFPTPVQARCNPVNTTPKTCSPAAATEPAA